MKKYKWNTHKVIQETKDAVTIVFDTGQAAAFSYQPGQYLNISCDIDGAQLSRSYSFSSAVSDPFPSITVKRIAGGKMSNYLVDHAADIREWDVEAPFGNFIAPKTISRETELVFLAGGSGITPLFSMLNSLEDNTRQPLLLYASHSAEDMIFRLPLEQLQTTGSCNAFYALSAAQGIQEKNVISGRFSQPVIQSIISRQVKDKDSAHYFICGPAGLIQLYRNALSVLQIPEAQVHTEYFDPLPADTMLPETCKEPREVLVRYFESYNLNDEAQTCESTCLVEVRAGQSILDALTEQDIKVPYSCRQGTCGSCRAIKEDGEVHMSANYALSDEEVAEGNILLCQCFPLDQAVAIVIG